jgi:rhodanese-related sulfurtransferase
MNGPKPTTWVSAIVLAGLIVPPVLSWLSTRGPTVSVDEAEHRMSAGQVGWRLVDVRSSDQYAKGHVDGAINIPFETLSSEPNGSWRDQLNGATSIMVMCNVGASSARAVHALHGLGFTQAVSVAGGLDRWMQVSKAGMCIATGSQAAKPPRSTGMVPEQRFSLLEQLVICTVAFGIKPVYELLALLIVIMLWRSTDADLAALRRSMIAFFIGENACTVNFLLFDDQSRLWEFFHSYGMLAAFGLAFYALMEAVDQRIVRFSERNERCALLATCGRCYKHQQVRCPLYRLFLFVPPTAAVLAFMLWTAKPGLRYVHGVVFGSDVLFGHPLVPQLFEVRLCPLLAAPFLVAAWMVLFVSKESGFGLSKILLSIGLGPLSFGLMRFLIYWGYSVNPLWADVWEELTELLFVGFAIWLVLGNDRLRPRWLARRRPTPATAGEASC